MQNKLKNSLQHKTDLQLVRAVKNKASSEAFIEICRRYQDVFYRICHKYSAPLSASGVYLTDIYNEKDCIILHCIKTFNHKKGAKLSSWIGNYARYLCLNSINARKFIAPSCDNEIQDQIESQQAANSYFESQDSLAEAKEKVVEILNDFKDQRIKDIFHHRYFSDQKMIWNQIAEKVNASPQTVMSLHKKGLILIKSRLKKELNSVV